MIDNQKFLIILQLIYMSWHGHGLLLGFRLIFWLVFGLGYGKLGVSGSEK